MKRLVGLLCLVGALAAPPALQAAEDALTLGIFPRYKATVTTTMFKPLAEHLGEQLHRKVALVTAKDFDSFWKAVTEQRYDIVHYNAYHYIHSAQNYVVIAHQQESGRHAVGGALFVRRDAGITSLAQLRGRTIIFGGGRDAMLSYIAPRFLLMQAGLNDGDFKSEFAVNPPNALLALFHRQADAAGGGDTLIDQPVVKNAINAQELTVLAVTEPLLFLPWAVKRSLPTKLRDSIQNIMIGLGRSEAGKEILTAAEATGMGKAEDKDYNPHRRMMTAVFGGSGIAR
jgi:phosphonate transport system substrate-binding protein